MEKAEKDRGVDAALFPGEHIWVRRKRKLYSHHGIYAGGGQVIHFTGAMGEKVDPVVRETELERFLKGGLLRRRVYKERLAPLETLRVARQALQDGRYSMVWNNCEHFATYCATGKRRSRQVRRLFAGLGAVSAGVAVFIINQMASSLSRKNP